MTKSPILIAEQFSRYLLKSVERRIPPCRDSANRLNIEPGSCCRAMTDRTADLQSGTHPVTLRYVAVGRNSPHCRCCPAVPRECSGKGEQTVLHFAVTLSQPLPRGWDASIVM